MSSPTAVDLITDADLPVADWIKKWLPELNPAQIKMLESYIESRQLDLVDQFRDHIEGAYAAVEMAMGEAYYQMTQADKKGSDNDKAKAL